MGHTALYCSPVRNGYYHAFRQSHSHRSQAGPENEVVGDRRVAPVRQPISGLGRTAGATHDLVEIIRVTKGRKPIREEEREKSGTILPSTIPDIELGRGEIEKQITERTRQKIADFGIELLDERFKRSKYNPAVAEKIIERMSSERHQIAARFRSEGHGEAANISGQKESEVASIISSANRDALKIEGEADAEAARIYANAYSAPDA